MESSQRRFAFGGLFAFPLAAGQLGSGVVNRANKDPVVVWAGGGNHFVLGRFRRHRLQHFLQFPLGVFQDRNDGQFPEGLFELFEDKSPRLLETGIQKDGAQQSLEGVGQRGGAIAAAVEFLPAAEDEAATEAKPAAMVGQGSPIDQLGPGLGERPFAKGAEFVVKLAGQDQLEDGIAEKFQPLVGLHRRPLFVGNGRMRQGQAQQVGIAKMVTEFFLEILIIGHGVRNGGGAGRRT